MFTASSPRKCTAKNWCRHQVELPRFGQGCLFQWRWKQTTH